MLEAKIRALSVSDADLILDLYVAASRAGTLGRDPEEYSLSSIAETIDGAVRHGFCLDAFDCDALCGENHASRLQPRLFHHVFAGLTVAVRPECQGRSIGRALFVELLRQIDTAQPPVLRTELMLQAGNPNALKLYADLGFREERRAGCLAGCARPTGAWSTTSSWDE